MMLRTIERFLDSVETDAQDPRIQPVMDWFERHRLHLNLSVQYGAWVHSTRDRRKESLLNIVKRMLDKDSEYPIRFTTAYSASGFLDAAMELARIIAAPLPRERFNPKDPLRRRNGWFDYSLDKVRTVRDRTGRVEGICQEWICFAGSSAQGEKAVVLARLDNPPFPNGNLRMDCSLKPIAFLGSSDDDCKFFHRLFPAPNSEDTPSVLFVPMLLKRFRMIAEGFQKVNKENAATQEIALLREYLSKRQWMDLLEAYCGVQISGVSGAFSFDFYVGGMQKIRIRLERNKAIIEKVS